MLVTIETLKEKLKQEGYKLTPQRKVILEVLLQKDGEHLSSEEIYDCVKTTNPEMGLATVYRALLLFTELDIVTKINIDDICVRYEINSDDESHQHHHLICTNCGKIIEVVEDFLDELESKIESDYDFQIDDHKLKFFGKCNECK